MAGPTRVFYHQPQTAMKTYVILLGAFLLVSLVACGGSGPPTHQLAESNSAVRAAEELGAANTPKAALHLKMARDHLKNAEQLIDDEEYEDASMVLKRAEADADLAVALARESNARTQAEQALRKVQELKRDME
jgi:Domain of unknown function (DUF4398)